MIPPRDAVEALVERHLDAADGTRPRSVLVATAATSIATMVVGSINIGRSFNYDEARHLRHVRERRIALEGIHDAVRVQQPPDVFGDPGGRVADRSRRRDVAAAAPGDVWRCSGGLAHLVGGPAYGCVRRRLRRPGPARQPDLRGRVPHVARLLTRDAGRPGRGDRDGAVVARPSHAVARRRVDRDGGRGDDPHLQRAPDRGRRRRHRGAPATPRRALDRLAAGRDLGVPPATATPGRRSQQQRGARQSLHAGVRAARRRGVPR